MKLAQPAEVLANIGGETESESGQFVLFLNIVLATRWPSHHTNDCTISVLFTGDHSSLSLSPLFPQIYSFIWMVELHTYRGRERKILFPPQITLTARAGPDSSQEARASSVFPSGCRGPCAWAVFHCFLSLISRGAGREAEQWEERGGNEDSSLYSSRNGRQGLCPMRHNATPSHPSLTMTHEPQRARISEHRK